jgi:transcriptional regulator with XRE-family HTH domain
MPTKSDIKAAREQAGLTQPQAAALLGVTPTTWFRYESGDRKMTDYAFAYWKHVAGLERLPFRSVK